MSEQKNKNLQFFLSEKQMAWGISAIVLLMCTVMITSYVAGYRSAIRNVIDSVKKDSFSDQLYTSITTHISKDEKTEGYYVHCKVPDYATAQYIIQLSSNEGLCMTFANSISSDSNEQEKSYSLISSILNSEKDIHAIEFFLKNKANIDQYDIVTIQKTQKLKGSLS